MKPIDAVQKFASENAFLQLLAQLDNGRVMIDAAEDYPRVVEAVKKTGMAGEITLKLVIKPDGKGEVETVEVSGKTTTKIPKKTRRGTTFFVEDKSYTLTRIDPKQNEMELPGEQRQLEGGSN